MGGISIGDPMKNIERARNYENYIIGLRRYFHENPELSGKEFNTLSRIQQELDAMGIEWAYVPDGGIIATIHGAVDNGRSVLLRADVDALAIQEPAENLAGPRICRSQNQGVMHACGHDGHMAMLLGAARILMDQREQILGTIYLCFEQGEETLGCVHELMYYIDSHQIRIDTCYAIHLYAMLDSGLMMINDTHMMSCYMGFNVTLQGTAGHGSRPDQANSPLDAFVAIYNGMQTLRLREVSPFETLTYSVGMVQAGYTHNIIPDALTFAGSVRTFSQEKAGMPFYYGLRRLIDNTCEAYGCKAIYNEYSLPNLSATNDPECAAFARQVIGADIGRDSIVTGEPWMASETYAQYLTQWPGVLAFLGVRSASVGSGAPHHNEMFDIDEKALIKGAAGAADYAMGFLNSNIDTRARKLQGGYRALLRKAGKAKELKKYYGEDL